MTKSKLREKHSRIICEKEMEKPMFNRPYELIDALQDAKRETGLYPVYSGYKRPERFVNFLTKEELESTYGFKGRKIGWKKCASGNSSFLIEIADTYAGGLFPETTPYRIKGCKGKNGDILYSVDVFIDSGRHIHIYEKRSNHSVHLKTLLKEARESALAIRGKCFDGYWY